MAYGGGGGGAGWERTTIARKNVEFTAVDFAVIARKNVECTAVDVQQ